uniref:uncharacterized protein LOC100179901 isoform X3 n=1 Tax=Ciona intestinalis TaxID=7719 RepID=UPI000EF537B7|nr:uncharacterized protein LOC100179901 isoform X3 [Ciona intestinalis]|eukprot:XP_026689522.1 uncharacterized protein LOC100179901 isoform X3 [Ciona intestinalis]
MDSCKSCLPGTIRLIAGDGIDVPSDEKDPRRGWRTSGRIGLKGKDSITTGIICWTTVTNVKEYISIPDLNCIKMNSWKNICHRLLFLAFVVIGTNEALSIAPHRIARSNTKSGLPSSEYSNLNLVSPQVLKSLTQSSLPDVTAEDYNEFDNEKLFSELISLMFLLTEDSEPSSQNINSSASPPSPQINHHPDFNSLSHLPQEATEEQTSVEKRNPEAELLKEILRGRRLSRQRKVYSQVLKSLHLYRL